MAVYGVQSLMGKIKRMQNIEPTIMASMRDQTELVRGAAVLNVPTYTGPWPFVPRGELKRSIHTVVKKEEGSIIGCVYSNAKHAVFVEFGTGPVGESNHAGTSPNVNVTHVQEGWVWQDPDGDFHYTEGQPAHPFMYPALKDMEDTVTKNIAKDVKDYMREVGGNQ